MAYIKDGQVCSGFLCPYCLLYSNGFLQILSGLHALSLHAILVQVSGILSNPAPRPTELASFLSFALLQVVDRPPWRLGAILDFFWAIVNGIAFL
jgi:hypothetical protein